MFALLSHQDDAMLGEALRSASGGFSEDASEQTAKGEEEDEYDYGNYWGSSSWGHHGVQDAKWLEPKDEWPVNPKSEDWGDDTGGWGGKQEWSGGAGWWNSNKWSGWNTGWNHNQGWKRKAPWAYNKHENPKHGQYVKGGFEADGEFYESL